MIAPRRRYDLPLPGRPPLVLGERTLVMGILNVTPDSFADGGRYADLADAINAGVRMAAEGADIIDVGGESTRPGAQPVGEDEERGRVLPVIEGLVARVSIPISIDTYRSGTARDAVAAGAAIVNDISGLTYDPELAPAVARSGAALVLMHNRGRSTAMYADARYADVSGEIATELSHAMTAAVRAGVAREAIVLDPGFGFAKRAEHTFEALARMDVFASLDRPLLSGPSRKSFLREALGERSPAEREWGTAAAIAASVLLGAHIVRVHGVREMTDVVRVADRIRAAAASSEHASRS